MPTTNGTTTTYAYELGNAQAAGSGCIAFATGSNATLLVDRGDAPANAIAGFAVGDTIDLAGVGLETTATALGGGRYSFSGGSTPVTLQFDPAQSFAGLSFNLSAAGLSFNLSADRATGSMRARAATPSTPRPAAAATSSRCRPRAAASTRSAASPSLTATCSI